MPLTKFATLALAALLAFGACSSEEDASVVRVTRNIGGRPGFQVHWDIWKATFERQNPGWTLELIDWAMRTLVRTTAAPSPPATYPTW